MSDRGWAIALIALVAAGCSDPARDFTTAYSAGTPQALADFLEKYPESAQAVAARTRIAELASARLWEGVRARRSAPEVREFLRTNGTMAQAADAVALLRELELAEQWVGIRARRSGAEVREFLRLNEAAPQASQAKVLLGEIEVAELWQGVSARRDLAELKKFVDLHPSSREAANAKAIIDAIEVDEHWRGVRTRRRLDQVEDFLRSRPNATQAGEASELLEELLLARALDEQSDGACMAYLERFSKNADRVRPVLEARLYQSAATAPTVEAIETYLRRFPDGKRARELSKQLEGLLLEEVIRAPTPDACKAYLGCIHGDAKYTSPVLLLLELIRFRDARTDPEAHACKVYLNEFPAGGHATRVRALLEAELFRFAESPFSGTASCDEYLANFPSGPNAQRVAQLLAERNLGTWLSASIGDELALGPLGLRSEGTGGIPGIDLDPSRSLASELIGTERGDVERSAVERVDARAEGARRARAALVDAARVGGATPMLVYFYVKTQQMLLSELATYIVTATYLRSRLVCEIVAAAQRGSRLDAAATRALKTYMEESERRSAKLRDLVPVFERTLGPLAGLLEDARSPAELAKLEVAVPDGGDQVILHPVRSALALIRDGRAREGMILLDAIGRIKAAYVALAAATDGKDTDGGATKVEGFYELVEQIRRDEHVDVTATPPAIDVDLTRSGATLSRLLMELQRVHDAAALVSSGR